MRDASCTVFRLDDPASKRQVQNQDLIGCKLGVRIFRFCIGVCIYNGWYSGKVGYRIRFYWFNPG